MFGSNNSLCTCHQSLLCAAWCAAAAAATVVSYERGKHLGGEGDVGGNLLVPLGPRAEAFEVEDEHLGQAVEAQLPCGCRGAPALVALEGRIPLCPASGQVAGLIKLRLPCQVVML